MALTLFHCMRYPICLGIKSKNRHFGMLLCTAGYEAVQLLYQWSAGTRMDCISMQYIRNQCAQKHSQRHIVHSGTANFYNFTRARAYILENSCSAVPLCNYSVTTRLRRFLVDNSESLIRQQNSKFSKDSSKNAHIMRANALALNETIVPSDDFVW